MHLLKRAGAVGLVGIAFTLVACGPAYTVPRVVDGKTIEGDFVAPEAYAAFLRGAMAEASGDLKRAASAYEEAAHFDRGDPETWTRLGAVRCKLDRTNGADADAAFNHALRLDPDYAPAWAARASCLGAKNDGDALAAAQRATQIAPRRIDYQILLASLEAKAPPSARVESARARILSLTLAEPTSGEAFRALLAFARAHGDGWLAAEAVTHLAHLAPSRRGDLVRAAADLAGEGDLVAARRAAAAIVDGADLGLSAAAPQDPARDLVARLAIDEAILRGDDERAARRATATHLGAEVAAGRALLLGAPDVARALALPVAEADPSNGGAKIVVSLAAIRGGGASVAHDAARAEPLPPEIALPLLRAVARGASPQERAALGGALPMTSFVTGDDLTARAAVDAVLDGALPEDRLDPNAAVELAVHRGKPFEGARDRLDARHAFLALTLPSPGHGAHEPSAAQIARLESAVGRDPIVTVAAVRLALQGGRAADDAALVSVRRAAPTDPLVLEVALALAQRRGDTALERDLRARITALGAHAPAL